MTITIFARKKQTREGRKFYVFGTNLTTTTGEKIYADVKFRKSCAELKPEECPKNIDVEKKDCNFSIDTRKNSETGVTYKVNTLWIADYKESEIKYRDTSMDQFVG